jgi:protein TonB
LKQSEKTALNTREYMFFGYYQRIRERLDRAWVPILREKLVRFYRSGRQLASDMDHTTKVVVTLNQLGEIVRVQVVSESGNNDLDDAAIKAFNRAGPFPNPPRGMVGNTGQIEIPWEFVLKS